MARLAPDVSRRAALRAVEAVFAAAGLPEPAVDARVLVEDAAGLRSALLLDGDAPLGAVAAGRLEAWIARRLDREPVFRILGQREFWGLSLRVTPDVLDPRPDTETVVSAILPWLATRRDESLRFLDLGTGSGALLCALLSEYPKARGLGVDRSPAACAVARENLAACGFAGRGRIVEGDWTAGDGSSLTIAGLLPSGEKVDNYEEDHGNLDSEPWWTQRFDAVVSNPPYIPSADIGGLDPEVARHDPVVALDGGADGLDAYRAIAPLLPDLLDPEGVAVLEVGATQAGAVVALLTAAGLVRPKIVRDFGGIERAVVARPSGGASGARL